MNAGFTYTADFQSEFLSETTRLLRRRLLWFLTLGLIITLAKWPLNPGLGASRPVTVIAVTLVDFLVVGGILLVAWRYAIDRREMVRLAFWFLIYRGVVSISSDVMFESVQFPLTITIFHMLAAALLPWDTRDAVRPLVVLLVLNAITRFAVYGVTSTEVMFVLLATLCLVPGTLIAWLKHARRTAQFKLRFFQNRYGQMRRELVDARRIHELVFPDPATSDTIAFDYRYEPMRQIGGDYLFARFSPAIEPDAPDPFNLIVLDVTGHGIPAALTVNRLSGEVERLFAEDPHAAPGDVLRALNRYVHLTIANHSVYATAVCLRVDPAKATLEYANGGHPPAFLRAVDGTIQELDSTAMVLGAMPDDDFESAPVTMRFGPGDTLLAYTDGATEARDDAGRMLRIAGLQRVIAQGVGRGRTDAAPPPGTWAQRLIEAVERHRAGPPDDDTLVVEVHHLLGSTDEKPGTPAVERSVAAGS